MSLTPDQPIRGPDIVHKHRSAQSFLCSVSRHTQVVIHHIIQQVTGHSICFRGSMPVQRPDFLYALHTDGRPVAVAPGILIYHKTGHDGPPQINLSSEALPTLVIGPQTTLKSCSTHPPLATIETFHWNLAHLSDNTHSTMPSQIQHGTMSTRGTQTSLRLEQHPLRSRMVDQDTQTGLPIVSQNESQRRASQVNAAVQTIRSPVRGAPKDNLSSIPQRHMLRTPSRYVDRAV